MKTGERIWNLVRCFNLAQGLDAQKDTLAPRFINEPLPNGPAKGHRISTKDMNYMRQEYYQLRGWDKKGVPLDNTLNQLRIEYASPHK